MRNKIKIAVIGLASMYTFTGCVTSGLEYKQYGVGSPSQVGYSDCSSRFIRTPSQKYSDSLKVEIF